MHLTQRKSRLVTFRVSPDEYQQLREACGLHKVSTISELARVAMHSLLAAKPGAPAVEDQIFELREYVRLLSAEIERLHRVVNSDVAAAQNGVSG